MRYFELLCFVLFLVLGAASAMGLSKDRCGGGEGGPKPLADFSDVFKTDVKMVPTMGNVEEFFFWEDANSIVYRNDRYDVFMTKKLNVSAWLTKSGRPLARLAHGDARFLATDASPWIFDRKKDRWQNYHLDARPFRHLFFHSDWLGDYLYSMSSKIDEKGSQSIHVYRYKMGDSSAEKVCKTITAKPGEHLILAEGHQYPHVYFYRVKDTDQGLRISIFRMNVGTFCNIDPLAQYTREIAGPVKSVHFFEKLQAIAVEVEHPLKNLLWDSRSGCRYFNIRRERPLVLNYNKPIIATFSQAEGFEIIYLEAEKKAKVPGLLPGHYGPIEDILPSDVWMPNDGRRLFVAPRFSHHTSRWLVRLTVEPPPSEELWKLEPVWFP